MASAQQQFVVLEGYVNKRRRTEWVDAFMIHGVREARALLRSEGGPYRIFTIQADGSLVPFEG